MTPEEKHSIQTNIKKDKLVEVLDEWVLTQIGQGRDDSPANEQETYRIEIDLDLTEDRFKTRSNTGNKGLTAGLVMAVLEKERANAA